jgi:hypothetical protein
MPKSIFLNIHQYYLSNLQMSQRQHGYDGRGTALPMSDRDAGAGGPAPPAGRRDPSTVTTVTVTVTRH